MIYTVILSLGLVLVSVLLLGIRVFFSRNGRFPETHVGKNEALRKRGIHCANSQDRQEQERKDLFDLP